MPLDLPHTELAVSERGSGPAVVLLHGFPLSGAMWAAVEGTLTAGWRVVTPDLAGFGDSPPATGKPSLDRMADDVAALLDRLGLDRVVLAGLSMGGYVAMAFARRHRHRLGALALLDTKAGADAPAARETREEVARAVLAAGGVALRPMLHQVLGKTTRRERPEVVARVRGWLDTAPPEGVAWAQRAMAARPDSFGTLRGLDVPALVLVGDEDELAPVDEARAMAAALPQGDLMVVNGCGHLSAVERPDAVSEGLRGFLAGL